VISVAIKEALNSKYKHRIGAVIVKGGRILSVGHNKVGHRAKHGIWESSVHAEIHAISKLLKPKYHDKLQGCKIFVARVKKSGQIGLAKPCPCCLSFIKSVGIREIIYTTDNQFCERIKI
jgi:tRNA(Arg) A34 adenosine deaminase TadA